MRVSSIRIYILINPFNKGLLTHNATWCQNRGCICISSVRRTNGRIHIPATIILWTELFPKKRREKIQGEILQSIFEYKYSGVSTILQELQCFHTQSSKFPVILCKETILHTELILLQKILQLQGSSRVIPCIQGIFQQLLPCLQALHTADSSYKAPYSIPGPYSTSRLPVILGGRNSILHGSQHPRSPYSSSQASSTVLHYRILPGEIGFIPRVKYCISNTILRSVCSNLFILILE